MKRNALALSALAVIAGVSACGGQQNPTQSQAYRYGKVIGGMEYLSMVNSFGKPGAEATCRSLTEKITSSFVPTAARVDFPQWKNAPAKGHMGWFFLGVKAGCK